MLNFEDDEIVVAGIACKYPDANDANEFWENILSGRRAFRKIPSERLSSDYFSDGNKKDTSYNYYAALLKDYNFNRVKFNVSGKLFRVTDLTHWLSLDVASECLSDFSEDFEKIIDKELTGVFLGNTLTGEFSRASLLRLRWPYVKKVIAVKLMELNWDNGKVISFLNDLEKKYKSPFEEPSEDSLAGGLSNTIAGRICNYFDFNGGGYTLDGACSSSLLAIYNACTSLKNGELEFALAGGVDLSLDPFELVGFSATNALAKNEMLVFDENSDGFIPGEGCGFVLLTNYKNAKKYNLKIYAVIKGWGLSSDGRGGLTRPEIAGQKLALERAYKKANYDVDSVNYFEAHGTGTKVGDSVELQAVTSSKLKHSSNNLSYIGSIKSNIGHTKAAAGIAGFIKAVLVLNNRIIPQHVSFKKANNILTENKNILQVPGHSLLYNKNESMTASVSSMGFGGINVHITLQEYELNNKAAFTDEEKKLNRSYQDSELLLFSADDAGALKKKITEVLNYSENISYSEITDLASALSKQLNLNSICRASITVSNPKELTSKLNRLINYLKDGNEKIFNIDEGIFLNEYTNVKSCSIAFLFPGQATVIRDFEGIFSKRFDGITGKVLNDVNLIENSEQIYLRDVQFRLSQSSLFAIELMKHLGIEASLSVGHSLGEYCALLWSGVYDNKHFLELIYNRAKIFSENNSKNGAMLSVKIDSNSLKEYVSRYDLVIACINCDDQFIISGHKENIHSLESEFKKQRIPFFRLSIEHAFHSPLMNNIIEEFGNYLAKYKFNSSNKKVFSSYLNDVIDDEIDIRDYFIKQALNQVNFAKSIETVKDDIELFIELGSGNTLTNFVRQLTNKPVISIDLFGNSLEPLLKSLGMAFVTGNNFDVGKLFEDRFYRELDLTKKMKFLENPCEKIALPELTFEINENNEIDKSIIIDNQQNSSDKIEVSGPSDIITLVKKIISEKTELPEIDIKDNYRMLEELHLNSITVAQIMTEISNKLNSDIPLYTNEYSNASVLEISHYFINSLENSATKIQRNIPQGIANWVREFTIKNVKSKPLEISQLDNSNNTGEWKIFSNFENEFVNVLKETIKIIPYKGVIVCLNGNSYEDRGKLLLEVLKFSYGNDELEHFILITEDNIGSSLLKSFHFEKPDKKIRIIEIKFDLDNIEFIIREIINNEKFVEVNYDDNKTRYIPKIKLLEKNAIEDFPLNSGEVLLVTGGGKGITAECALKLGALKNLKLILLGRANPVEDENLQKNLERFSQNGVEYIYYPVDITDCDDVSNLFKELEKKNLTIKGMLHGAGINNPKSINSLSEKDFLLTYSAKVNGLLNILKFINPSELKLLVTFGSILARIGIANNSDYAYSNEVLSYITKNWSQFNLHCKTICLEWSVWGGIGMGENLGVLELMSSKGVAPVTLDDGVNSFLNIVQKNLKEKNIIVSGRFGNPVTLEFEDKTLPILRFINDVKVFYPDIELITEAEISEATDLYINDHVIHGAKVMPAVFGLEAFAQMVRCFKSDIKNFNFYDIEFLEPVIILDRSKIKIRILALKVGEEIILSLRSSTTNYHIEHFKAKCNIRLTEEKNLNEKTKILKDKYENINPESDIYGKILFHKGLFKKLTGYKLIRATECIAEVKNDNDDKIYSSYLPQENILGNPFSRDAAIHCIQACIPHSRVLPESVERITIYNTERKSITFVKAFQKEHYQKKYIYDIHIFDEKENLIEKWEGLKLSAIENFDLDKINLCERLIEVCIERIISDNIGDNSFQLKIKSNNSNELIIKRPDGKPEIKNNLMNVSISNLNGINLLAKSDLKIGCDVEHIQDFDMGVWYKMLDNNYYNLARELQFRTGESFNETATRAWSIKESLKKIGKTCSENVVIDKTDKNLKTITFEAANTKILSLNSKIDNKNLILTFSLE